MLLCEWTKIMVWCECVCSPMSVCECVCVFESTRPRERERVKKRVGERVRLVYSGILGVVIEGLWPVGSSLWHLSGWVQTCCVCKPDG